ncbi:hypothetical protein ILYODFUR_013070, partial [Ilyodon furcidens]
MLCTVVVFRYYVCSGSYLYKPSSETDNPFVLFLKSCFTCLNMTSLMETGNLLPLIPYKRLISVSFPTDWVASSQITGRNRGRSNNRLSFVFVLLCHCLNFDIYVRKKSFFIISVTLTLQYGAS